MRVAKIENCALAEFKDSITAVVFLCGCELDCDHCQNDVLIDDDSPECKWMSPNDVLDSIKWEAIDGISITGGEPLIHKEFEDVIYLAEHARRNGKLVNIDTNGYFFQEEKIHRLKMIARYINAISVDIKSFSTRYLAPMLSALRKTATLPKARFRTVILSGKKVLLLKEAAVMLSIYGVSKIKIIRNSGEGRGANFPRTKDKDVEPVKEFYEKHGIYLYE